MTKFGLDVTFADGFFVKLCRQAAGAERVDQVIEFGSAEALRAAVDLAAAADHAVDVRRADHLSVQNDGHRLVDVVLSQDAKIRGASASKVNETTDSPVLSLARRGAGQCPLLLSLAMVQ